MITSSHLIYSWAAARGLDGKLGESRMRVQGMIVGGFLPDLPVYLFFFYHTLIAGTSQNDMWETLYFNGAFSPFITLAHSFIIWPILLAASYALGRQFFVWVAASAILHSIMDFFVHVDDAYRHFYPFSNWKWRSPASYWDPQYYGNIIGALDTVVIFLLLIFLMKKTSSKRAQHLIIVISLIYLAFTLLAGYHPHHGQ